MHSFFLSLLQLLKKFTYIQLFSPLQNNILPPQQLNFEGRSESATSWSVILITRNVVSSRNYTTVLTVDAF